jgi:S1-C subfamily serine protease
VFAASQAVERFGWDVLRGIASIFIEEICLILQKKIAFVCVVVAALSVMGYAQTTVKPRSHSTNLQVPISAGWLGVGILDLTQERAKALNLKDDSGVEVTFVTENGPGAKAGIHLKDVILEIDGQKVDSMGQFQESIMGKAPGIKVHLTLARNGVKQTIVAALGPRPAELPLTGPVPSSGGGVMLPYVANSPISPEDIQAMLSAEAPMVGFDGVGLMPQLAEYFGVHEGVLVQSVTAQTPAAKAGLKAGDVVTRVNGIPVSSPREISGVVRTGKKTVTFTVIRNKKEITLSLEIARMQRPADQDTAPEPLIR